MRRRRLLAAGVPAAALLAAGTVVATSARDRDGGNRASAAAPSTGPTVAVQRRTLVDRRRVDGTLGYSGRRSVATRLPGTITSLPHAGAVVQPGHALFTVDRDPIVLMDGALPAFRALHQGLEGRDVAQLEGGLAALGYDPGIVDGRFTATTASAVKAWQRDRGLHVTGAVELGRVVFLPGARRVTTVDAELGAAAGGPVLSTTSTRRVVTAKLDAADQTLAQRGGHVRIELPDARIVSGTVASVGTVASAAGGGGSGGDSTAKVTVTISLRTRGAAGRLDQAPVSVQFARTTRRHVLAVPVQALVARAGGGYALQRADGRLVAVTPGLFADGYVEISGRAVGAGDRVQAPR
jgi:peptidoglycan hydrolase-like protein with peptidoglycan-binding domain